VLVQHLEHRGAREARERARDRRAERDRRHDEVPTRSDAGAREHSQPHREDEYQQDPEEEIRDAEPEHRERHDRPVDRLVAVERGDDAERHADHHRHGERHEREIDRRRQRFRDHRNDRTIVGDRYAQVAACDTDEIAQVLLVERTIEAVELPVMLDYGGIGLVPEHGFDGIAGDAQDDECEGDDEPHRQQRAPDLDEDEARVQASSRKPWST
jgi:hypothetical protein